MNPNKSGFPWQTSFALISPAGRRREGRLVPFQLASSAVSHRVLVPQGSGSVAGFPPPLGLPQRSADWSARIRAQVAFRLRRARPDGATTGQLKLAFGELSSRRSTGASPAEKVEQKGGRRLADQSSFHRGKPNGTNLESGAKIGSLQHWGSSESESSSAPRFRRSCKPWL